jgi:hypothetical protein
LKADIDSISSLGTGLGPIKMIGGILEGLLYTTTTEYDDCASYLTD